MVVLAESSARTVVLLLPDRSEMYPLSTDALTRAQGSRANLAKAYSNAFLLDADGSLRKVERIEVLGPLGDTLGRKVLSRLTDAWSIRVQLSDPAEVTLQELKALLLTSSAASVVADNFDLEPEGLEGLRAAIRDATSVQEVISSLRLPDPSESLDVL